MGFATADGAATAPADYTSTSGTLTWAAGDGTSMTVSVPVVGDTMDENDETFVVDLSSATNAFILDSQGTGTITDNDLPPSASIDDVSTTEGNSGTKAFTFTVSLSAASGKTITVDYATADVTATAPSDYTAASGTLTFNPGVTTQQVAVNVNGDATNEPDETFVVNLSNPANVTILDAQGQGTIQNDDAVPTVTGYSPVAVKQKKPVTILGSAFTGATQVAFSKAGGGTVNGSFSVVDDGHIAATVPSLATTGPVFVTNPAGTNSTAPTLKIKPAVKSFTPTSGPVGTSVTITGSAFTGASKVLFNGVSATFTVNSDTQITATVPVGATTGVITVTTAGGKGKSSTVFTVT